MWFDLICISLWVTFKLIYGHIITSESTSNIYQTLNDCIKIYSLTVIDIGDYSVSFGNFHKKIKKKHFVNDYFITEFIEKINMDFH